jgi:hypothetical protein
MRVLLFLLALAYVANAQEWCPEIRETECQACNGYLSTTSCQCKCQETPLQTLVYTFGLSFLLFIVFLV